MYTLLVNGTSVTVEEDLKLIDVLRNDLAAAKAPAERVRF